MATDTTDDADKATATDACAATTTDEDGVPYRQQCQSRASARPRLCGFSILVACLVRVVRAVRGQIFAFVRVFRAVRGGVAVVDAL